MTRGTMCAREWHRCWTSGAEHSPEYFRIGTTLGLQGTLNELVWCEALSRIFPNRAPLRGFEAPSTSWCTWKCQFFEMWEKIIRNRMKVEIYILIWQVKRNYVQFSAEINVEMTQKKLFEIFKWHSKKIEKLHLRCEMASAMHLDESGT